MAVEVDGMGAGDDVLDWKVGELLAGDDQVDVAVRVVLGHDGVFGG